MKRFVTCLAASFVISAAPALATPHGGFGGGGGFHGGPVGGGGGFHGGPVGGGGGFHGGPGWGGGFHGGPGWGGGFHGGPGWGGGFHGGPGWGGGFHGGPGWGGGFHGPGWGPGWRGGPVWGGPGYAWGWHGPWWYSRPAFGIGWGIRPWIVIRPIGWWRTDPYWVARPNPTVYFGTAATLPVMPTPPTIVLDPDEEIDGLTWSSWNLDTAFGTGVMNFTGASVGRPPANVRVELSNIQQCASAMGPQLRYQDVRVLFPDNSEMWRHFDCF